MDVLLSVMQMTEDLIFNEEIFVSVSMQVRVCARACARVCVCV